MRANKPIILFLYGVALYFVLKQYYRTNSGLPSPEVIRNPTYLYGMLALISDFTAGLTIPLAAGMTVALIWQINKQNPASTQAQAKTQGQNPGATSTKATKAGSGNGVVIQLPKSAVQIKSR